MEEEEPAEEIPAGDCPLYRAVFRTVMSCFGSTVEVDGVSFVIAHYIGLFSEQNHAFSFLGYQKEEVIAHYIGLFSEQRLRR